MTDSTPRRDGDYLWDRSAPVDPVIVRLEETLGRFAYDAKQRPLVLPRAKSWRWPATIAAAAVLLTVVGLSTFYWRLRWPAGQAWSMTLQSGTGARSAAALEVGRSLDVGDGEAHIDVARLGAMRAQPGTMLQLQATSENRHVLAVDRGKIEVRVWSPPGRFVVETPSGTVRDLGCAFKLIVDERSTTVLVRSGTVQIDNGIREMLVPEGTISIMSARIGPTIPIYEDAAPAFVGAVRSLESGAPERDRWIGALLAHARRRDVYTLLMLIRHGLPEPEATRVAERAAELLPPPAGVSVQEVVRGNEMAFWRWYDTLPLPSPKKWMNNWHDGLPSWLRALPRS